MENKLEKFSCNWRLESSLSTFETTQKASGVAIINLKEATETFMRYMALQDGGVDWLNKKVGEAEAFAKHISGQLENVAEQN
ncbi:MAG: hypothetical protein CMO73_12590 [Verrucomicrobiales bacterium]|nr:hypothetical protein [Verrucomicrobiales bacterium]